MFDSVLTRAPVTRIFAVPAYALTLLIAGCTVNPVTGEREISFVTPQQEIAIGNEQYLPSQQMQGGAYVTDVQLGRYVDQVGQRVARASGVQLPYEFVVLNNSVPNAWALPGGKIAVNRGLLTALDSEAELAAVLGHEVAHAAARHGAQGMNRNILIQTAVLAGAVFAGGSEYGNAVVGAGQLGAQLITQRYGRDAEREADYYGTEYMQRAGYDPSAAITLQETFVKLSKGRNTSWAEGLFSSHPPSQERVDNNRRRVAELGVGGELGPVRYNEALARVRGDADGFAAYDEGRKALADGDSTSALSAAETAISVDFGEASFHGLRGDVRSSQQRHEDAITNFDRAIERDDGFFAYYLGRGLARAELQQTSAARTDLERSVALLPTTVAYNALGRIAEGGGDVDAALRYYGTAAQSKSPVGQDARLRFVRLDIARRPAEYVKADVVTLDAGPALRLRNAAGVDLIDINVAVRLRWADGAEQQLSPRVAELAAGQQVFFQLPTRAGLGLAAAQAYTVSAATAPGSD
jgi:predicted Zn-dependent protease